MKIVFKRILSNIHRYILCALGSVLIWTWIFMLVTDAPRTKKITVMFDTVSVSDSALAAVLKEDVPKGLRTVKVRHVSYMDMTFGMDDEADIYIIPGSKMEASAEYLVPLPYKLSDGDAVINGEVYGWLLNGAASSYAVYDEAETYYLCFSKTSPHLGDMNDSKDDAALKVAEKILSLP
ncbi:MAG: hypothetical protein J5854_01405 [Clostridia bacterium]|nr:hypothetical protein [Clostridia bacterium]